MIPNKREHSIAVIYLITCLVNGKIYVGSAKDFYKRYWDYEKIGGRTPATRLMEYAIKKYGFSAFEFSILEYVSDPKDLLTREQYYLDTFRPWDHSVGYNVCKTAGSRLGMKHSAETKAKISANQIGKKQLFETIEKRRLALVGQKRTEEVKKRLSAIAKKRYEDPALRVGKTVLKIDKETLKVLAEYPSAAAAALENGSCYNSISSVCHKRQRSAAGYFWAYKEVYNIDSFCPKPISNAPKGGRGLCCKPVIQLDKDGNTIRLWDSAYVASVAIKKDANGISSCCRGKQKSCGGYCWRFITDNKVIQEIHNRINQEWENQHA